MPHLIFNISIHMISCLLILFLCLLVSLCASLFPPYLSMGGYVEGCVCVCVCVEGGVCVCGGVSL